MLMPAVACFSKLKRDKRHTYRHPLPAVYQTYVQSNKYPILWSGWRINTHTLVRFFGQAFSRRFPASWVRFLWFMTSLAIASFSLIVGQGKANLFSQMARWINFYVGRSICESVLDDLASYLAWCWYMGMVLGDQYVSLNSWSHFVIPWWLKQWLLAFFFLNFFSRPIVGTGIILHSWSQSTKSCFAFHIQTLLPIGLPRLLP